VISATLNYIARAIGVILYTNQTFMDTRAPSWVERSMTPHSRAVKLVDHDDELARVLKHELDA